MPPVNIWNTTLVSLSPSVDAYKLEVGDLSTLPDLGVYDYTLEMSGDLNALFQDFVFMKNEETQEYEADGQLQAWEQLHKLLKTGTAGTVTASAVATTLFGGIKIENPAEAWNGFWAHLLSEAVDDHDKAGISVKHDTVQTRTNHHTNLGVSYDISTPDLGFANATTAGFYNDVSGGLNDMMSGYKTVYGATQNITGWAKVPQTPGLETAGKAADDYFPALAHFLYQLRGAIDGTEGSLTGNPTGIFQKFALLSGDSISIRMSCSMNFSKMAKITITQV